MGSSVVLHYRADGSVFWDEMTVIPVRKRDDFSPLFIVKYSDVSCRAAIVPYSQVLCLIIIAEADNYDK